MVASVSELSASSMPAPSWLEEIVEALTQDSFVGVLKAFVVQESPKFLAAGELTLEQAAVHESYMRLYDSRIASYLKKHDITEEAFKAALQEADAASGSETRREERSLHTSLLKVHDISAFRKMMLQHALEQSG